VQFDELRFVCQQAAVDLATTRPRPLPPTVVLPGSPRTRLLTLTDLPEDDAGRADVLARIADAELTAGGVPCWGFVAEADVAGQDALVVVYGARRHVPHLTAAPFDPEGGLAEFVTAEELDRTALPFLHPLQRAVDALPGVDDVFGAFDPKRQPWAT
jgi:hypothetical protein